MIVVAGADAEFPVTQIEIGLEIATAVLVFRADEIPPSEVGSRVAGQHPFQAHIVETVDVLFAFFRVRSGATEEVKSGN